MAYLLSPGVIAREKDYSLVATATSTTVAGTVIASEWGPCEEIVNIYSENDILRKFYKPTINKDNPLQSTYVDFFTMSNFLGYGNNLKAIRLVGDYARNANAIVDEDGSISALNDLIIKNNKQFEARRNSGLLTQLLFAAKYPSSLGNSIAVSVADHYSFPFWDFKSGFSYAPAPGEFCLVVVDTAKKWQTDAVLDVIEKFENLSFIPGDKKFDGSSKYYKSAINQGSEYIWVGEKDFENEIKGTQVRIEQSITDITVDLNKTVIDGSTRTLEYINSQGISSRVLNSLFSISGPQLTLSPSVVKTTGFGKLTQTKTVEFAVIPTEGVKTTVDLSNDLYLLSGDSIIVSFMGDNDSVPTFIPANNYDVVLGPNASVTPTVSGSQLTTLTPTPTISNTASNTPTPSVSATPTYSPTESIVPTVTPTISLTGTNASVTMNMISIHPDVIPEQGMLTVKVIRSETFVLTATPYVITIDRDVVKLSNYPKISVNYVKTFGNITQRLKSTDFARSNVNNTITIDPGIITTVARETGYIYISFAKDPNPDFDTYEANGSNPYSFIKLSEGVSDNDIGTLNDENLANVCNGFNMFRNSYLITIDLIILGQYCSAPIANWVISNVVEVRQDCVVFISPPLDLVLDNYGRELEEVINYKNSINYDTSYGVMDSGWKYQYDRFNDTFHWIPLNPDIAGLCARTDYTNDCWWSPAGFNRGKISNCLKLAWNPGAEFGPVALSGTGISGERDELYQASINPVVSFKGEGVILFGDKTMTLKPSAFSRINVRRLFNFIKRVVSNLSKYFLFEFNDAMTREYYKSVMVPFFRDIEARRGIQRGGFKIICDEQNNTAEVIDRNEFKAAFLIKPNRSINFIYLDFVAVRSDSSMSFSEIQGL